MKNVAENLWFFMSECVCEILFTFFVKLNHRRFPCYFKKHSSGMKCRHYCVTFVRIFCGQVIALDTYLNLAQLHFSPCRDCAKKRKKEKKREDEKSGVVGEK